MTRDGGETLLVGGKWIWSGARFETSDPATGAVLREVSPAGPAEVDAAVTAARRAFPAWSLPEQPGPDARRAMSSGEFQGMIDGGRARPGARGGGPVHPAVLTGGRAEGAFVRPTVVVGAEPDSRLVREEICGRSPGSSRSTRWTRHSPRRTTPGTGWPRASGPGT
ncbi:aldehyde dehydrogenase family protein [Pseudonocardia xishanensis]|uniref:Aldehyde dehydrogenase domain-containing protein n=1 Tax=Pseudonocardia xishanensis TaxID=630995 RepID=A0ABP8RWL6_9PSEU